MEPGQQAGDTPNAPSGQTMRISPSAKKLADRYGVSPEVMEEIISDTRNQASARVEARGEARGEASVRERVAPVVPLVEKVEPAVQTAVVTKPVAEKVVTPGQNTVVVADERDRGLSAGSVILGILLILAIVLLFYFRPWTETQQTGSKDSTAVAARIAPPDTLPATLPAMIDTVDHSKDAIPVAPAKHHRRAHRKATPRLYTTSSPIQAQERLAELRASGNSRAYLETVERNGNTYYRLHQSRR
jgi:hypothetical protein